MLKQTDERYVPWSDDLCTGYEHIHRYLFAKKYASCMKVLDLACGEGYGSWFLSQTAEKVIGIDISEESIAHARETYQRSNLSYYLGSIIDVPIESSEKFDLIVCFEALEHIAEQKALLDQVKRLLTIDGIFIVSTPNKPVYSENGTRQNPYHVKELEFYEFESLLQDYFKNLMFFGQKTYAASKIFPIDSFQKEADEYLIHKDNNGFAIAQFDDQYPRYFICIASNKDLSDVNMKSYLTDISLRNGYIKWEHTQCEEQTPKIIPIVDHQDQFFVAKFFKKMFKIVNAIFLKITRYFSFHFFTR